MKKLKQLDNVYEDQETLRMLRDAERGEFVPVKNQKKVKEAAQRAAARYVKKHNLDNNGNKKNARINIRIAGADVDGLRHIAEEEGLPYQTLIASILHKYVKARLPVMRMGTR